MNCPYCGSSVPERMEECPFCGAPLPYSPPGPALRVSSPSPAPKRRKPHPAWVSFLLILALCAAAYGIVSLIFGSVPEPLTPAFHQGTGSASGKASEQDVPSVPILRHDDDADRAALSETYLRAKEIIPSLSMRYYLTQLDADALSAACLLYEAASDFSEGCLMPSGISEDTLFNVFFLLEFDCPELLQVSFADGVSYTYDEASGEVLDVALTYRMTQDQYTEAYNECRRVIDDLCAQAQYLSDGEKERLVFDHITQNCIYSLNARYADSAYGALVRGRAKCDGITYAATWLFQEMGLRCLSVAGYPTDGTVGHAWNLVEIDGRFYGLDITADVPQPFEELPVLYQAYNVPNSLILGSSELDESILWCGELPETGSMEESYYVLQGRYIPTGSDYSELLSELMDEAYYETGWFSVQFESEAEMDALFDGFDAVVDGWLDAASADTAEYSCWTCEGYNVFYAEFSPTQ